MQRVIKRDGREVEFDRTKIISGIDKAFKALGQTDNNGVADDNLSLLNLIDFIKRSAISKGEKVLIYLPSARMRRLLREFLEREI